MLKYGGYMKKVIYWFALVLTFSCAKNEKVNLFIFGGVYRSVFGNYQSGETYVELMCDPILKSITIKVNGEELPVYGDTGRSFYFYAYDDELIPSGGSEHKLEVETDVGNANATSKVPGDFTATIPDSIAKNVDLSLSWTEATDAKWYMVFVEYDTGYYYDFYKDTVIYTTQKSLTITGSWFDKDGWLFIYIVAGDGPKIEAGSQGNINGAKGFWLGINQRGDYVQVGQGSQMAKITEPKKKNEKEIYKAYLREMAKYNEDAEEIIRQTK